MANIKKSFNFRNGVQVDDDNLKVSSTGLVGIGTTVPTEALDVRGNLVVSGVSSAVTVKAGVITVTTLNPTEIIGAGVSVKSGIITASSGIITFFGDASNLQGMPTSQWEDVNLAGLGFTSIYNTGGNVGIATTNPSVTLQVGPNPDVAGQNGVGINSSGDIVASGVITATTFSGVLAGNVTGDLTGNTQGIHTGAVNLGDNVKATFGSSSDAEIFHDASAGINDFRIIDKVGHLKLETSSDKDVVIKTGSTQKINLKAIATEGVEINFDGTKRFETTNVGVTISSQLDTTNLNVSGVSTLGVSTFTSTVSFGSSISFNDNSKARFGNGGDLAIHHGGGPSGEASYIDENGTGKLYIRSNSLSVKGITANAPLASFIEDGAIELFYDGTERLTTSGVGVTVYNQIDTTNIVASGVITATTELNSPLIGVGTDAPVNPIQVRGSGNTEIQVTSDGGIAGLTVGRESGTGDTNNAEFRYGGGAGAPYSSAQSLDILNYGTGNFNYHISANNAGAIAGDFHWHKGKNNTRLMTLTGIGGSLGIGITTPTQALHVAGNAFIAGNLTVDDTLTAASLNVSSTVNFSNIICGTVTGTLNGNINSTSGISTFSTIKSTGNNTNFAGIGIKTDNTSNLPFDLYGNGSSLDTRVFISANGRIGIKTDEINPGIDINAVDSRVSIQSMGVGTTNPQSAVDMRFAGQELTGIFANRMYMYPPQVNDTQRGNLAGVAAGAVIYNTTSNKLQVYNGSAWQDCN